MFQKILSSFVCLALLSPALAGASGRTEPGEKRHFTCADEVESLAFLSYTAGVPLALAGALAVALPLAAEEKYGLAVARALHLENFLEPLRRGKWVSLAAGSLEYVAAKKVLAHPRFRLALAGALREADSGIVGYNTSGLSIFLNNAIYSGRASASELLPDHTRLSKALRLELAGALNHRRISALELQQALKLASEDKDKNILCTSVLSPTEWIELMVWTHTRLWSVRQ